MATRNWLKEYLEEELTTASGKVIKRSGEVVKEAPKKAMSKIPASTGVQNKGTLSSSASLIGRGTAQQNGLSMIPKNNNESINTVKSGIKRALYGGNAAINGVIGTTANAIATPYNAVREVVAEQSTNSLLKNQIEKQKNLLSQIDYLRNYKHKNDEAGLIADPEYQQANKALESYTRVINAVRNNASSKVEDTPFTAAAKNTIAKSDESRQKATEGLSPAGQFVGNLAISGGEMLATLPVAVASAPAYIGLQAANMGGRKAYDVEAQGGSAKEALLRGSLSAGLGAATSTIGLDRLVGSAKGLGLTGNVAKDKLINTAIQAVSEGGEEGLEYVGNYALDKMVGDENARFDTGEFFQNVLGGTILGGAAGYVGSSIGSNRNKSAADILKEQTLRNNAANNEYVNRYITENRANTNIRNTPLALPQETDAGNFIRSIEEKINAGRRANEAVRNNYNEQLNVPLLTDRDPIYYGTSEGLTTSISPEWVVGENNPQKVKVETERKAYPFSEKTAFVEGYSDNEVFDYDYDNLKRTIDMANRLRVNGENVETQSLIAKLNEGAKKEYEFAVKNAEEHIKNYKPQGVQITFMPSDSRSAVLGQVPVRTSNNETWYSDFYKANGRAPRKSEARSIAEKLVNADINRGGGEWISSDAANNIATAQELINTYNKVSNGKNIIGVERTADGMNVQYGDIREQVVPDYKVRNGKQVLYRKNLQDSEGKVVDEIKIEPEQKSSSPINAASSVNAIEEKSSARADIKNMSSLSDGSNINYSIYNTEGNYNGNNRQSFDKNTVIAPGDSFNNDSIGAASYNPNSVREQLDILAEANGAIPEGENAVRYANLPKSTDGETQVSRFARTLIETENTPDILVPELEKAVLDGKFSHIVSTDKKAIDNAVSTITKSGYDNTYNSWKVKVDNGQKITKEDIAIATQLYNEACTEAAKGDTKAAKIAMELASDMIAVQTNSGQVVQAASLMKKQTPTGKLYAMQKLVDTINKKGKNLKKVKGEKQNVVIESELAQKLLNAQNDTEAEVALDNIKDNIASQLNSTMAEALNQWRYTSMLANPKTHIRNLVGNAVTQELYTIKDIIGTAIESSVDKTGSAINGVGLENRTKAVLNRLNENDRKLIDFAKNDYKTDTKDILQSNNKYNEATDINSRKNVFATNPVARVLNKTPFAGKMLNVLENAVDKVAKTNSKLLDIEDNKFLESNYTRAFAQYMKANDFTPEYFKSFEGQQDYNKARQYAIRQAQEATFHDDNKVAAKLNELQRTNAAADFFIGTFLPFKKTPMNIVKRGVEYSPIGLAKGTKNLVKDVTVNKSVAQTMDALDEVSKGLTGTGLMLLGAYAASKGIVNTMVGEDDRERALLQSQGEQDFAFRFNNKSYTIDSFAPAAIPFLTGAAVYESLSNDKDFTDFTIGDFTDAMTSMSEPMIQTSMLSSLNDMLTSLQYADNGGGKMLALGSSLAKNYAGQFIPTVFSATANTLDDTKRSTYIDKNSKLGNTLESIKQQMKYKTPGLHSDLEPYLDVWGQEDINNNVLERVFNNYLNPISVKDIENNTVNDEVLSLYKATGETSIMPRKPDKYTNVNNERVDFTAEQYTKFVKARNGETYKDISKLINMPEYANLSDEQRANIIEGLWDYNTIKAKEGLNIGYSSNDDKKIDTLKENGFTSAQAILFKQTLDNISAVNGEKARAQKDYIQELDLSKKQKEALSEMYVSSSSVPEYTNGAGSADSEEYVLSQLSDSYSKAWSKLKKAGLPISRLEELGSIVNSSKTGYTKEQKISDLQLMGYSYNEAIYIWDSFKKK